MRCMGVLLLLPGRSPMFPPRDKVRPGSSGLVGLGGDLRCRTLIEAYRKGIFPWAGEQPIPWYSPDPRMILRPSAFRASRSLRKLRRQGVLEVRLDTCFEDVMRACASTPRPGQDGTWISEAMIGAYRDLHEQGIAHSVEVFEDGVLAGGLYGLAMGTIFFGESMFHRRPDASKVALWHLCERLEAWGFALIDCQQQTRHLASLGAAPVDRADFLQALAVGVGEPERWGG
ncbi:MAG: leucyl/phenylalanyl-tRNA--protein transferase [Myxococcota bacterium]|jgi:leucyl/phenylalanyl-tRNA--protein transferase